MLVADLITDEIPPLKHTDTVELALRWMEEFKVSHLAVVKGKEFLGLASETDLLDYNHAEETLEQIQIPLLKPIIHNYQHTYDLLKLMTSMNLTLVPVLDDKEQYKGCITLKGLVQNMASMTSVKNPGGVIVLELNQNDYSLTQIANIVEGNDTKILSAHVSSLPDSTKMEVTLKLNKEDLTRILQTFYRYNYNVKASFHQSGYEDDLKNRFNEFMHFLNI